MKPRDWKEIAELIGIAAIVASLIFVGVQLKQEQQIALTEIYEASVSSATELDIAISENANIWLKSNRGEALSDAESLIINRLVAASYRRARGQANMRRIVGTFGTAAIRDFAIELYENPGVRRVWEAQIDNEVEYFKIMAPQDDFRRRYRDEVLVELAKLEAARD
jgi:hypothetical protein